MTLATKDGRQTVSKHPRRSPLRELYQQLHQELPSQQSLACATEFLQQQLLQHRDDHCDLPNGPQALPQWLAQHSIDVAQDYADYLDARRQGQPRRFFSTRSHALDYLAKIAPTKLVDGAWLYGLLAHWQDHRFLPFIRTYLEELGEGEAEQNHVALYRRLLASHDLEEGQALADRYYVQGCLQLALAYHGNRYLPELLGYNLGYEQPPLHLLITRFELDELNIDPYYFSLHITIDNASSGHARRATEGLLTLIPGGAAGETFYRRVRQGYQLNHAGPGVNKMLASFDLQDAVLNMLRDKAVFAYQMHSDYCRIGGKTVNQWLRDPEQMPQFLHALTTQGWIRRHQDPRQSRFWRLLQGQQPAMFGVFKEWELQLLWDWIAGDWQETPRGRAGQRTRQVASCLDSRDGFHANANSEADINDLEMAFGGISTTMDHLMEAMSPSRHSRPDGLVATRLFRQRLLSSPALSPAAYPSALKNVNATPRRPS